MSVQNQDEGERTAFAVLIPLIVLVVGFVVGLGIHKAKGPAPKPAAAVVAEPAPAPAEASDEARVVVDNGVVKFYFASGKAIWQRVAKRHWPMRCKQHWLARSCRCLVSMTKQAALSKMPSWPSSAPWLCAMPWLQPVWPRPVSS